MLRVPAENGFSLFEVLVSIAVLAAGVFGAAALHLTAMRTAQEAGLHSLALQLAGEMADRMRANHLAMRRDDQDNPFLATDFRSQSGEPSVPPRDCHREVCSDEELALFDLHAWQRRLADMLPGVRAVICRDDTPWDRPARRFTWACNGHSAGSPVVIKIGWQGRDPRGGPVRLVEGDVPALALVVSPYLP